MNKQYEQEIAESLALTMAGASEKKVRASFSKISFDDLITELEKYWLSPDPDALRMVFSVLVAFKMKCDPIWVFLIAPPASLKTEFITGLSLIDEIYNLSSLTPQTLVSGLRAKGKKSHSLLEKIESKVLTFKDFTTVLSGRWDDLQKILAQLREIYDGKFVAEFGTGVKVNWQGKMGFLAGVTQKIDEHSTVSASLGERFIQYRMSGLDEIKLAMRSMKNAGKNTEIRKNVTELFYGFWNNLKIPKDIDDIKISDKTLFRLAHLSSFVVRGRSGTSRDYRSKELTYIPDPEAPARLAQQLAVLAKCLAVINNHTSVTSKEYQVVTKVAFDSIPRQRLKTLNALFQTTSNRRTTSAISEITNYSTNATRYFLEDMAAFNLVTVNKMGKSHIWEISKRTKKYIVNGLIKTTKPKKEFKAIFDWFIAHGNSDDNNDKSLLYSDDVQKKIINNREDIPSVRVSVYDLKKSKTGAKNHIFEVAKTIF